MRIELDMCVDERKGEGVHAAGGGGQGTEGNLYRLQVLDFY